MEIEKIKEFLKSLETTSVQELELEVGEMKLKVKFKRGDGSPIRTVISGDVKKAEVIKVETESEGEKNENIHVIEAPLVGTFYRAPAPGAEPFVKEGDFVEKGQTLCIIEALKVMNEIESDVAGRVVKILAEDGQPVEYGQPLFHIEKV